MARSMWKGVISFGMVSIPVRLYVATESHSVSFRQLCGEHLSPIKYKRWCQTGDHEVSYSDIVKGYEVGADNYVVIQDAELDNLPLPTSRQISIDEFVPNDDIEGGLYFKSAYYIEPEQAGLKPYHLLRKALAETGMTAVAKIAFRDREHLCSLRPHEGLLLMNTLHWPDEIRPASDLKGVDEDVEVNARELQMAKALVENLAEERFDPGRFQDDYHEALMEVVNAKVQGEEVISAPEVEAAPAVMDLMEALKASVDQAKKQRTSKARTRKPAAASKAAAG
ncbi:MAG TPA: Ku protein [Candidatus Dormibacteraeota bacterium]